MRKLLPGIAAASLFSALLAGVFSTPAQAALKVGERAPDFVTRGALDGKAFRLHLARELRKGPVVLYFFPKAFTKGCTLEARAFSEAAADFRKAGAQVIGMSADDLPTLKKFSVEGCRSAFPVAIATKPVIKGYDVAMPVVSRVRPMTDRTSYVIGRDGRIAFVHSELDWSEHVAKTLAAVKALKR